MIRNVSSVGARGFGSRNHHSSGKLRLKQAKSLVYLVVLQVDTDEIQGNTWDWGALSSSTYRKSGMDRRCSYAELRF